jgi:putative SOS response-associated peptidase YedK
MCGRFVTAFSLDELIEEVEAIADNASVNLAFSPHDLPLFANYNAAPTHAIPVVTQNSEGFLIDVMQWGLVPSWSKDPSIGSKMINARSETLTEKPSFRNLVKSHRCFIPINGFYEWDRTDPRNKVPYFVPRADGALMLCAGLWNVSPALDGIKTFTMITKPSIAPLAVIHDRSPVQFDRETAREWLQNNDEALSLMSATSQPAFAPYAVSAKVNSVRNNYPSLLDQAEIVHEEPDTLF